MSASRGAGRAALPRRSTSLAPQTEPPAGGGGGGGAARRVPRRDPGPPASAPTVGEPAGGAAQPARHAFGDALDDPEDGDGRPERDGPEERDDRGEGGG